VEYDDDWGTVLPRSAAPYERERRESAGHLQSLTALDAVTTVTVSDKGTCGHGHGYDHGRGSRMCDLVPNTRGDRFI